ncbi:site-specific integrase [Mucilaginibacter sp. JRF]|uniref:site-specific integrase n=1 Tax=Mucilaginibacter sp. JRF TaxID=2780088 RepID=UPI001881E8E8|nr:site-specific integrase [Mucilaginibacter sp. JRF]MBE9586288.1 site-specific integrase [Mucilaginibacter sp. JRF]
MKTTNRLSIHFKVRAEREKDGKAPVYMGLTVNGSKSYLALKSLQVNLIHWDISRGCAYANTKQGKKINNYLDDLRLTVKEHYRQIELKGYRVTIDLLKNAFFGIVKEEQPITFADLLSYHNEQATTLLAEGTMRHYYVTQRYLIKFFQLKFNSDNINLTDLDYKFIADFELFLYNHKPKDHQKPMDTNGVLKHLIRLKKMVNLAVNLKWITSNPFAGFKMSRKTVDKEFLNEWELKAVENKYFEISRLNLVKDMFIFACYTGLAYIDMINLKLENIVTGSDGEKWIRTFRQKTLVPVNTPILPNALRIIERYKENIRAEATGTIFPVISNQKINSYLKEIADHTGVRKNITFHVARHTFATTITLSNGVPIETVSKMLGHSKLATTQIYARVLEKKISDDMAALRAKLE